jgi:hypothetical protein
MGDWPPAAYQLEALLAAQMAAVHTATMTLARRLAHVENIPQQDSAERAFQDFRVAELPQPNLRLA